jgi:hypothetical protein
LPGTNSLAYYKHNQISSEKVYNLGSLFSEASDLCYKNILTIISEAFTIKVLLALLSLGLASVIKFRHKQFGASLTDGSRGIIRFGNLFITQATGAHPEVDQLG